MGKWSLTFAVEKPTPAAQAAPSSAKVVPFNKRGRLLANFEPTTSPRTSEKMMPPPSAAIDGSTSGSYGPRVVIIDFAHADRDGHAAKRHEYWSSENETDLTAADLPR
jgi:hypothetical protein